MDGSNGRTPSRWHRYIQSAVDFPRTGSTAAGSSLEGTAGGDFRQGGALSNPATTPEPPVIPKAAVDLSQKAGAAIRRRLLPQEKDPATAERNQRRTDLRLVPATLLVWAATVAGPWLTPVLLLLVWSGLAATAGALLAMVLRRRKAGGHWRRSFLTTLTAALMLAAASTAHSAVSSTQRSDGHLAALIAGRASVVTEAELTGEPRALKTPGPSGRAERWAVVAVARSLTSGGQVARARLPVVIIGGQAWQNVGTGQLVRVTGKLRPPDAGRVEAAILTAS